MVKIILLLDKEEKYLHELEVLENSDINKEVLNGEDILNLTISLDVKIEKKYRILTYINKLEIWKEFIVEQIEEDRLAGIQHIYAENSIYETLTDYIEDKRAINSTCNIALARALSTSRFEVGRVDDLGINSITFYNISVKEAIQNICQVWNGELKVSVEVYKNHIIGRYVDILAKRGDYLGERFTSDEDLVDLKRTINTDNIVTALYGYGKGIELENEEGESTGGYGRRLNFADINGGKKYVENIEARDQWGRLNSDGTKAHAFNKVEFDDIEDMAELKVKTTEMLEKLSQIKITLEGNIIGSVSKLGDTIVLVDDKNDIPFRVTARIYEIENHINDDKNSKVILGNYRVSSANTINKDKEFIDKWKGKENIWDKSDNFDEDGNLNTQYLDGVIDVLKNKILSTMSGWYTDDLGNIVLDAKDGSSSMMLSGAGFLIANSKLANGNWDYRTFGTGNGFVADEIIAGVLKGGKVKFDLTNGTLLIGNSIEDYSLFFDGNNLLKIRLSNGNTIEEEIESKAGSFEGVLAEAKEYADTVSSNAKDEALGQIDDEIEGVVDRIESNQFALDMVNDSLKLKIDNAEFQDFADVTRELIGAYQSDFEATARKWDLNFTTITGNNLLKNSVGYADTSFWETTGKIETEQSDELEVLGSGSAFLIPHGGEIRQNFILETDKFYTFSFMYVMNYETTRANILVELSDIEGDIMIVNESVNFYTTIDEGYKLGTITFKAQSTNMRLRIRNISGSVKVTNSLINEGEYRQSWSNYKGEVYTTNVLQDAKGIRVRNLDEQGRVIGYTEQTPTQFAGYYDDITVFKMNKEVFQMNEAHVNTIKIGNVRIATNGYKLNFGVDLGGGE